MSQSSYFKSQPDLLKFEGVGGGGTLENTLVEESG